MKLFFILTAKYLRGPGGGPGGPEGPGGPGGPDQSSVADIAVASELVADLSGSDAPISIRKDFPETWIWEDIVDSK
jgi:hypothetical protein